ncbi:MAG: heavy-metal-associated domain-containing protein [Candidatus Poribacteria bacterium]
MVVQAALKAVPGVLEASVSFEKNLATVKAEKGKVKAEQLIKAVSDAGYQAILLQD